MHNDTPLGAAMHLKELDRQAMTAPDPSRAGGHESSLATAIGRAAISLLRRLHGIGIPVRAASRG